MIGLRLQLQEGEGMANCERTGEAIGGGAASVTIEGPGSKGSCRKFEVYHHKESLWEAVGESTAQVQQKTPGFWRYQDHEATTTKSNSNRGVESARA